MNDAHPPGVRPVEAPAAPARSAGERDPARQPAAASAVRRRPEDSRVWQLPNGDPPPLVLWGDEK